MLGWEWGAVQAVFMPRRSTVLKGIKIGEDEGEGSVPKQQEMGRVLK